MILNTSDNLEARVLAARKEDHQQKIKTWLEAQVANCQYIDDPEMDPTNAAKRIGAPLHHDALEKKLTKLNPSLRFTWNQFNSTKKCLYFREEKIPYEAGIMPERSIMSFKEELVPVTDIYNNPHFGIDRKDLGPNGENTYMRKVKIPWNEVTRGWRTVLIKLVAMGALTPHQVEVNFGAANNPEWQNHMGKATHLLPW